VCWPDEDGDAGMSAKIIRWLISRISHDETQGLEQTLPLENGQRVRLTVHTPCGRARASACIYRWQGDRKDLGHLLSLETRRSLGLAPPPP
jgi:hypothetical protein